MSLVEVTLEGIQKSEAPIRVCRPPLHNAGWLTEDGLLHVIHPYLPIGRSFDMVTWTSSQGHGQWTYPSPRGRRWTRARFQCHFDVRPTALSALHSFLYLGSFASSIDLGLHTTDSGHLPVGPPE